MKKTCLRWVLACLFTLSLAAFGAVFTEVASGVSPLGSCPKTCVFSQGCPGTLCTCTEDQITQSYYCKPPAQ